MRPGDLLLFGRGRSTRISHVGIYVGDGRMIHASTSQRRVVETRVPARGASLNLRSVRRVLRDSTTARSGSD
jgi:cell wall-associated NlpC family hydrolase